MKNIFLKLKNKKSWNTYLAWVLAVLLVANLIVMVVFTVTVSSKLGEAIELSSPQKGTLTLITATDCSQCRSLDPVKKYISGQNVEFTDDQTFSAETQEGQDLINQFAVEKLPALIFSSEDKIKTQLKTALQSGSRGIDDTILVWEQSFPPYFDIKNNLTVGLVEITFLTDKSCSECYDVVKTQKALLKPLGVFFSKENIVDISDVEGKKLLEDYSINQVPTIILSGGVNAYEQLNLAWNNVGTVEEDGSFVFRKLEMLKTKYKDLSTGRVTGQS